MRKRRREADVLTTPNPSEIGLDDSQVLVTPKKKQKDKKQKKVESTPKIGLADSEILVTPKNQQKDKKRKKKHNKVEIIHEPPLEAESNKNLKKIIDGLSDRLNEMTEIVKKLKETSDLLEKEKETPEEKVVECLYESKHAFIEHHRSIFVSGFDCSFPKDEIKSTLIKHFSSCGEVAQAAVPFHCETGSPMGFAFINMVKDEEKALTLDGSYLGGLRLEVTMAINRSEYYGYTGRRGCKRCRIVLMKRRMERFYSFPTLPFP